MPPSASGLGRLLDTRRVILVVGCGGVGKTTTTAALGLAAARRGKRVLCLTIDPAKRLSQSLGFEQMTTEAQHVDPAVFARDYVQSVTAWGGPLLLRAFAREGTARAAGLLAEFLGELQDRVSDAPDRHRWDYVEALVICRKASGQN